jgi:Fanconi anemia group M protein
VRPGGYRLKGKKKRQAFILQGLPGIGAKTAKRLLNAFGSVEAVIRASSEELQSIEGIGQKSAERIRWIVT